MNPAGIDVTRSLTATGFKADGFGLRLEAAWKEAARRHTRFVGRPPWAVGPRMGIAFAGLVFLQPRAR